MNPDPAELVDRLDLSISSIDMTNTSLAMHEEKDSELSGVGKLTQQQFIHELLCYSAFTHLHTNLLAVKFLAAIYYC